MADRCSESVYQMRCDLDAGHNGPHVLESVSAYTDRILEREKAYQAGWSEAIAALRDDGPPTDAPQAVGDEGAASLNLRPESVQTPTSLASVGDVETGNSRSVHGECPTCHGTGRV